MTKYEELLKLYYKKQNITEELEKRLSINLPMIARVSCIREIMVNEIIKTNGIEGVRTTKKDVYYISYHRFG